MWGISCFQNTFFQRLLPFKFAANGRDIEQVMIILFCTKSSGGAMPVCANGINLFVLFDRLLLVQMRELQTHQWRE